jgi:hypothetical protein
MFAIFGLGLPELLVLGGLVLIAVVAAVAVILVAQRQSAGGRAPSLEQLKQDYLNLPDEDRRALLEFIEADLRRRPS